MFICAKQIRFRKGVKKSIGVGKGTNKTGPYVGGLQNGTENEE